MTSTGVQIDKPLELIQKTYHIPNPPNPNDQSSHGRASIVKNNQSHHPSRKTSVHDVQEATREEFNKTVAEIHESLARLNGILETMTAAASIREEFVKVKLQIVVKITEFILKLTKDTTKRSETNLKMTFTYNPQHLVYCVDFFRSELYKAQYLFSSLTLTASIGSSTLENLIVRSLSTINVDQTPRNATDGQLVDDLLEMQRDLVYLEEHVQLLNQCYAHQISDWQTLEDLSNRTINGITTARTTTALTTGNEKLTSAHAGLTSQRLGVHSINQKLSATSSTTSIEHSSFCARLYRKCQMVCCICTPNYL